MRLGKYELIRPLAAGGMAQLFLARSTGIGAFERHVVVKILGRERIHDPIAVRMFLDEARLAALLNHHNVAQVFEVGAEAGVHYFVMEYVHGQDLRAILVECAQRDLRFRLELGLTVVASAAAGLHHAHERRDAQGTPLSIVHRDVSPANVMVGYDGSVKLVDFGIAKAAQRSVQTQSGIIKGKFAYMSPEQCRGKEVDRRSDVFALGIVLYEATTQMRAFRAKSDFETMNRIVNGHVRAPHQIVPDYPAALEAVVMKALSVDPNQRYQTALEMLGALEAVASERRLALSNVALGRFMCELYGDVPEPWLESSGVEPPVEPKSMALPADAEALVPVVPTTLIVEPAESGKATEPMDTLPADVVAAMLGEPLPPPRPVLRPRSARTTPMPPTARSARTTPAPPAVTEISQRVPLPLPAALDESAPVRAPTVLPSDDPLFRPHVETTLTAMPWQSPLLAPGAAESDSKAPLAGGSRPFASAREAALATAEMVPPAEPSLRGPVLALLLAALGIVIGIAAAIAVASRGDDKRDGAGSDRLPSVEPAQADVDAGGPIEPDAVLPSIAEVDAGAPDAPVEPDAPLPSSDPAKVIVHVESKPSGAAVYLRAKKLGSTPLDYPVTRGTELELTLRRSGYVEELVRITAGTGDDKTMVKLRRRPIRPDKPDDPPAGSADPDEPVNPFE